MVFDPDISATALRRFNRAHPDGLSAVSEQNDDELVKFIPDDHNGGAGTNHKMPPLVVLVVDDDNDVHDSTRIALAGERVLGRRLEFLHAYSANQARQMVLGNSAVAMILLDVVMETEDAGMQLLADLRDEIDRRDIRVIIRTGQPGYVPDAHFEDNRLVDAYLLKSRLTRGMLLDAIAAALAPDRGPANA